MIDAGRPDEPGVFVNFGLGSAFVILLGVVNQSPLLNHLVGRLAGELELPTSLNIAIGGAAVFLLFGIGRLSSAMGGMISGLTIYKTFTRYKDFTLASARYSNRDWELFLALRRELVFLDGLLGVAVFAAVALAAQVCLDGFTSMRSLEFLFYASVVAASSVGVWQNRVRVAVLLELAPDKTT